MNLDHLARRVTGLDLAWNRRSFFLDKTETFEAGYRFRVAWNGRVSEDPSEVLLEEDETARRTTAHFEGLRAQIACEIGPGERFIDEIVTLEFDEAPVALSDISIGIEIGLDRLAGFRVTPIPFRIGLDGSCRVVDPATTPDGAHFAEGWVLENGESGILVMRVPSGSAWTCFVPLAIRTHCGGRSVQIGSFGPDGDTHQDRNAFLDFEWDRGVIELPRTRFVFFEGDWKTGCAIFRRIVERSLLRLGQPRRNACPITYNTYHDFGPSYQPARLREAMPILARMGFGMLHLDPGWETVWGSNVWDTDRMGEIEEFVELARSHGLEVGCWTSVHTTDPSVYGGNYALDRGGDKYLAEDFAQFNPDSERLWGVCPASRWRQEALAELSALGRSGIRFLNSDFHDWPWTGESCWSREHGHRVPLARPEWAEALNEFYCELHRACPELVIELHDHVESGAYRTPVWYLYDRPDSYDEKWAYEFMWSTYQDLLDGKLFSLYYVRLAEPIPVYLHMNAASDNDNALAFWYVASCVNHIGVRAVLKCEEKRRAAYASAFAAYNERFEAFALGAFHGLDELSHIHVYPDRRRAVLLAFNLDDEAVTRDLVLDLEDWEMEAGEPALSGASLERGGSGYAARVEIPARGVAIADMSIAR